MSFPIVVSVPIRGYLISYLVQQIGNIKWEGFRPHQGLSNFLLETQEMIAWFL